MRRTEAGIAPTVTMQTFYELLRMTRCFSNASISAVVLEAEIPDECYENSGRPDLRFGRDLREMAGVRRCRGHIERNATLSRR